MRLHCALLVRGNIRCNSLAASVFWQKRNYAHRFQINERSGELAPPSVSLDPPAATLHPARMRNESTTPRRFLFLFSYSVQSENLFLRYSCRQKVDDFLNGVISFAIRSLQ